MQIAKMGRIALGLLLNLLAVLLGVAILTSALGRGLWHPHTIQSVLRVSYSYDILVSLLFGFVVYSRFKTETAKWVWLIGGVLFLLRVATLLGNAPSLWSQMSGMGCINGMRNADCMNWFLFTMPLVRATAYSIGAWLCSRYRPTGPSAVEDAFIGRFRVPKWDSKADS